MKTMGVGEIGKPPPLTLEDVKMVKRIFVMGVGMLALSACGNNLPSNPTPGDKYQAWYNVDNGDGYIEPAEYELAIYSYGNVFIYYLGRIPSFGEVDLNGDGAIDQYEADGFFEWNRF